MITHDIAVSIPPWRLNPGEPGINQAWPGPFEGKSSCSTWAQQRPVAVHPELPEQGAHPHLLHMQQVPAQKRWLGVDSLLFRCLTPCHFHVQSLLVKHSSTLILEPYRHGIELAHCQQGPMGRREHSEKLYDSIKTTQESRVLTFYL